MAAVPIAQVLAQYSLTLPPLFSTHSDPDTTEASYPQTDMQSFQIWDSFESEVAAQRPKLQSTTTTAVPDTGRVRKVVNEADVVSRADQFIFSLVEDLMLSCGTNGNFAAHDGNKEAICVPDRVWNSGSSIKSTFLVEFESWWAFKENGDLTKTIKKDKVNRAVGQLYGYMCFNHLRYGALSNFETTWFFRRVGASDSGVFEVTRPISYRNAIFLVEAFMFILSANDWFHASPFNSPSIPRVYEPPEQALQIGNRYTKHPIALNEFHLTHVIQRSRCGSIFRANLGKDGAVVMKLVDASKNAILAAELRHEVSVYQRLEDAQGEFVPRLVAYGEIWNMIHFKALEHGICNLASHLLAHPKTKARHHNLAKKWLHALHSKNITHGDVKLENFILRGSSLQIIDFGFSSFNATQADMQSEMEQLEQIFE